MYKKIVAAVLGAALLPSVVEAQIVQVGPLGGTRVRAPFVDVDVSPWGDTRVRAPFTAVDAPGRRYLRRGLLRGRRYRDRVVVPYRYDYPRNDYYSVPSYPSYRIAVPERYEQPRPTPAPQYEIPSYSEVFPSTSDPASGASWEVGDDPTRLAENLADAASRLQQSLERRQDGSVWINYLRPRAVQQIGQSLIASRSLQSVSLPEVRALLTNFDAVTANPSLRWLSDLSGFGDTRRLLYDLVTVLESSSGTAGDSPRAESAPRREELPVPPPDPRRRSASPIDAAADSDVEPPPAPQANPAEQPASADQPPSETQPPPPPRPSSSNRPATDGPRLQPPQPPVVRGDV